MCQFVVFCIGETEPFCDSSLLQSFPYTIEKKRFVSVQYLSSHFYSNVKPILLMGLLKKYFTPFHYYITLKVLPNFSSKVATDTIQYRLHYVDLMNRISFHPLPKFARCPTDESFSSLKMKSTVFVSGTFVSSGMDKQTLMVPVCMSCKFFSAVMVPQVDHCKF